MSRFWLTLNREEPLRSLLSFLRSGLPNCNLLMMDGGGAMLVGDDTLSYEKRTDLQILPISALPCLVLTGKIYRIK